MEDQADINNPTAARGHEVQLKAYESKNPEVAALLPLFPVPLRPAHNVVSIHSGQG